VRLPFYHSNRARVFSPCLFRPPQAIWQLQVPVTSFAMQSFRLNWSVFFSEFAGSVLPILLTLFCRGVNMSSPPLLVSSVSPPPQRSIPSLNSFTLCHLFQQPACRRPPSPFPFVVGGQDVVIPRPFFGTFPPDFVAGQYSPLVDRVRVGFFFP